VIEGDLATGTTPTASAPVRAGRADHHRQCLPLDAQMVHDAVHDLPLDGLDVLSSRTWQPRLPGELRPRQHRNVTLLSVPEATTSRPSTR